MKRQTRKRPAQKTAPAIALSNVVYHWRAHAPAVVDIEAFSIARGERVFLQGASGSGKSTLLALLAGVTKLQDGEIAVLGQSLGQLSGIKRDAFRADHIGVIFQLFNLLPYLSVLENVLLPCRFSAKRRERAQHRSGSIENEARRLLTDLDLHASLLPRSVTELSVGQQQRVAAARALIGDPEIVLADEPTSALDADRRKTFLQLLLAECHLLGTTLLFVSHDATLAKLFDRQIKLESVNRARPLPQEVA